MQANRAMKPCLFLLVALLAGLAQARSDVLDQAVTLEKEADLLRAVSITLQHAVATSEQYRGTTASLQRFAREEISTRRKSLVQLGKWGDFPAADLQILAIQPRDDASYVRAMRRNHARLIELIEYGRSLPLSAASKRFMVALSRDAASEFAFLNQQEKS